MKITYDPEYNIAYIQLRSKKSQVTTVKVSAELNVDISPNGKVYGFELLNANEQLKALKNKGITVTNKSTGKTVRLPA